MKTGIFLLHLALHEISMCQADAAIKFHLPMPCNQQDQVVALINLLLQDQKAKHSLLHKQVPQNRGQNLTYKAQKTVRLTPANSFGQGLGIQNIREERLNHSAKNIGQFILHTDSATSVSWSPLMLTTFNNKSEHPSNSCGQ